MRFETKRGRRRRELMEGGFRPEWRELLERRMAHWSMLDDDERARLERLTLGLLIDLRWEAAQDFELDDGVEVTIAAQAALLLLGLPDDSYRRVRTVVVHRTTLVLTGERSMMPGLVTDGPLPILGQASPDGTVLIIWDAASEAARHPERGYNVVYHEFAHKLDMLDGSLDGTPPLTSTPQSERWVAVCTDAYERVGNGTAGSALRAYAGVNPAEFFAVATESFFDIPDQLRAQEPELYDVLADFYRQDPWARSNRARRRHGGD